ncbi:MAG TPA: ClpXP protease specificity-enhancing factor [Burkholderiales bacterium]|nr:ClpXP protease specificity-enhancing factor [Burkholderiales bacterium]
MSTVSTKPYLIRAIYEWCADHGQTPHLSVKVDANTRVPIEYVKSGEIVLNIGTAATRNLVLGNDSIQFSARFGGVPREIWIPVSRVAGIFSRENGEGLFFQVDESEGGPLPDDEPPQPSKPRLTIVK